MPQRAHVRASWFSCRYEPGAPAHVNGPGDVRVGMLDTVVWSGGWPAVPEAPSVGSRPVP